MYNNGGAPIIGGSALAVTGVSSLQTIGLAMIAITLCISGLLVIRSAKLRQHEPSA